MLLICTEEGEQGGLQYYYTAGRGAVVLHGRRWIIMQRWFTLAPDVRRSIFSPSWTTSLLPGTP